MEINYNEMFVSDESLNKVASCLEETINKATMELGVIGSVSYHITKEMLIEFIWKCPIPNTEYTIVISKEMFLKLCNPSNAMKETFEQEAANIYGKLKAEGINND